jgi:hypothetical protein
MGLAVRAVKHRFTAPRACAEQDSAMYPAATAASSEEKLTS